MGEGLDRQGFKLIERCCTSSLKISSVTLLLLSRTGILSKLIN
jgi:hypothetical protein